MNIHFNTNNKKIDFYTNNNFKYIKNMYKNYIIVDVNWSYGMNTSKALYKKILSNFIIFIFIIYKKI